LAFWDVCSSVKIITTSISRLWNTWVSTWAARTFGERPLDVDSFSVCGTIVRWTRNTWTLIIERTVLPIRNITLFTCWAFFTLARIFRVNLLVSHAANIGIGFRFWTYITVLAAKIGKVSFTRLITWRRYTWYATFASVTTRTITILRCTFIGTFKV